MAAAATILAGVGAWFARKELRRWKRRVRYLEASQFRSFRELRPSP